MSKNRLQFLLYLLLFIIIQHKAYSFNTKAKEFIVYDYNESKVLFYKNAFKKTYPSSLTKIMVAYIIFDMIKEKKISINDTTIISKEASSKDGSSMFLQDGSLISIDQLIKGMIVVSGNDAATALAEFNGDINSFILKMNQKAKQLNLKNTNFTNPIGFNIGDHYMSIYDISILIKHLIIDHYDMYKKYFAIKDLKYNGVYQENRNHLISFYPGADGVKTGYTKKGGYGIAVSSMIGLNRIIMVANGFNSEEDRISEAIKIMNYGLIFKYTNTFVKKLFDCDISLIFIFLT